MIGRRKKSHGFDLETKRIIMLRAGNCCERCGISIVDIPADIDHRRTRGSGGTRKASANQPSNGSCLCRSCHQWKHDQPNEATATGWMVRQWEAPETVPLTDLFGQRFLFDGDKRVDL